MNAAIAKMTAMRQHAHAHAELMLDLYVRDQAPDKHTVWNAFSGLLDDKAVNDAEWGGKPIKSISSSSREIYDISTFNSITGSASIASPAANHAYHLTAAKVKQSELPLDYEPLPAVTIAQFKGKAPATSKKRAHGEIDGEEDFIVEEEEEDGDNTLVV